MFRNGAEEGGRAGRWLGRDGILLTFVRVGDGILDVYGWLEAVLER